METTRQQKISRLIQKDLSEIFRQECREQYANAMITVTKVTIAKDMSLARVYLSIFAVNDKDIIFKKIVSRTKEIRFQLSTRVKHQLRVIPDLLFFMDDSLDYIENIENLLKES